MFLTPHLFDNNTFISPLAHRYYPRYIDGNVILYRSKRQRPSFMRCLPLAPTIQLIEGFRAKARDSKNRDFSFILTPPSPFTEVVVQNIKLDLPHKLNTKIPIYLKAMITFNNLPTGKRTGIPANIENSLQSIGKYDTDDAGHLLAYAIGGGMDNVWNYVPQARGLNRNVRGHPKWFDEEKSIANFLKSNKKGQVEWTMYIHYGSKDPNAMYRPVAFCLQHTDVDNNGLHSSSNYKCFSNDQSRENPKNYCEQDRKTGLPT